MKSRDVVGKRELNVGAVQHTHLKKKSRIKKQLPFSLNSKGQSKKKKKAAHHLRLLESYAFLYSRTSLRLLLC